MSVCLKYKFLFVASMLAAFVGNLFAACVSEDYNFKFKEVPVVIDVSEKDTTSYAIPSYFINTVLEKELLFDRIVRDLPASAGNSYIFFTDFHIGANQKHSPEIIRHIVDHTHIKNVLFGGDVITVNTLMSR